MSGKKIIIMAICLTAIPLYAQKMRLGVFFDPAFTWLRSDVSDVSRTSARMGFDMGLKIDFHFAENYAFATGLSLFNTGGTLRYANGLTLHTKDGDVDIAPEGEVKYKLQYVKIPLGLNLRTHEIGRLVYYATLGFDPMVRITSKATCEGEDNMGINDETKLLNLGWHAGGGIEYPLGADASLMFGFSYMNMFVDMTKPAHDKISANNLLFRIGVIF